jgi:ATP-dependent protease ClpP protease subunit
MPAIAELLIYDVIGFDFWSGEGVTAKQVVNFLAEQDEDAEVHVRINSPGGDVFDGTAIYNALSRDSRRVVVHVEGLAASAASLIAMAGDEINMAQTAMMMIHGSAGLTFGTAVDHEDMAEVLRKIDGTMAKAYASRTGADINDIETWMAEETWMDGDEAGERGFADNVVGAKGAEASWGRSGQRVMASFRKIPEQLTQSPHPRPFSIAAQAVEEKPMDLTKICAALGLPEDAHLDTILAAIEARAEALTKLQADLEAAANIELIAEPDPRVYASREDLDKVRAQAKELSDQLRDRDLEDLLQAGEGKVVFSDSDRDRYRRFVKEGGMTIEALREEIENKPKSPLAVKDEPVARDSQNELGLTEAEIDLCKRNDMDPKRYAENKAKRAGNLEVA